MFRKLAAVLVTAAFVFTSSVAPAAAASGVSGNMDAYWSDGLSAASVTGPSAYTGQAGGYYTGGNLSLRTPQDNYHLASVALPSIKGGCGGIDLFTGAFSFVGADQLIAMIKNIASNAAPYAFMLALTLISSPIADQLKTFEDWAQKMNAFNISSCEAAEKIVDAGATALLGKSALCERLGREHGTFSDGVAARNGCSANPSAASPSSDQEKAWDPVNRNLAWDAIQKHPLLAGDHELGQLLMTVTGSIIITCPDGASGIDQCQKSVLPARGGDESVVEALLDGGTILAHQCDEFDKCLNPVANQLAINVSATSGLKAKVLKELTTIVDNIRSRTPLTGEQVDFVNMTSLPVYKMASVYASLQGVSSEGVMGQYAEVIALDITYTWLMKVTREVEEGRAHLQGIPVEDLNAWSTQTQALRTELLARQEKVSVKMTALEDMIGRTREIEKVMQGETAGRLAEAIAYANALRR